MMNPVSLSLMLFHLQSSAAGGILNHVVSNQRDGAAAESTLAGVCPGGVEGANGVCKLPVQQEEDVAVTADSVVEKQIEKEQQPVKQEVDPFSSQARFGSDLGVPQVAGELQHEAAARAKIDEARRYMSDLWTKDEETYKHCRNRDRFCAYWSVIGECERNIDFMAASCAPVCSACIRYCNQNDCSGPLVVEEGLVEDDFPVDDAVLERIHNDHESWEDEYEVAKARKEAEEQKVGLGSDIGVIQDDTTYPAHKDAVHKRVQEAQQYMESVKKDEKFDKFQKSCRNVSSALQKYITMLESVRSATLTAAF